MEYEIDEMGVLLDSSTNPSLTRRRRVIVSRLFVSQRARQRAVLIPEEEDQLA